MTQGLYHHLRQAWKKPDSELLRHKMIEWRKADAVTIIDKPLRLDRARALGYKAKTGFVVARVRVKRGGRTRVRVGVKGRKTRKQTNKKVLKMSYQWVAELRASKHHKNLEVLNSYWIGQDGRYYFYEVIMVDPSRPEIKNDKSMSWIYSGTHKGRAERGLTSAAKKSRGLMTKSRDKKVRPSLRAWNRRGK